MSAFSGSSKRHFTEESSSNFGKLLKQFILPRGERLKEHNIPHMSLLCSIWRASISIYQKRMSVHASTLIDAMPWLITSQIREAEKSNKFSVVHSGDRRMLPLMAQLKSHPAFVAQCAPRLRISQATNAQSIDQ